MSRVVAGLLAVVISYLAGSLPFGYVTARLVAGIDIRTQGSGNVGATNIGRVVGVKWGILVLLLDCLKGLLPVLLLPRIAAAWVEPAASGGEGSGSAHVAVAVGTAAILGHMYPPWLGFRGGKGVATAAGVVLTLGPSVLGPSGFLPVAAALTVFALSILIFRIVSLGSILAAVAFAVSQMMLLWPNPFSEGSWSLAAFSLLVPMWIIVRHRANVSRLLRGEEPRFRPRKNDEESATSRDQS